MMDRQRRGLFVLMAAVSLSLAGQTAPLNPLVTRTPQSGVAPVECAEGVAPAPLPRVDVGEIPLLPPVEPAELPAPPTGSLRSALEAAQTALARNDRPAFNASLAEARELLAAYPSGAQRRSAEELVRIYDTTARLWDAQYDSPFFDEASQEYAVLRGYSGYEDAVRRSTLTRDGRRWFPAGESRDFLGRIAAERLRGIGIQAPAPRLARNERPGVPDVDAPRASSSARRPAVSRSTGTSTGSRGTRRTTRPPRSAAPSRPRLTTETRTPATATSTPGTPNPPASPTAAAAPEPAAPLAPPAAEETGTEDVPVEASGTTETTETTATPDTMAPSTAAPEEAPAATEPSRGRSVVLPTILILIGLGVLILLFRASK